MNLPIEQKDMYVAHRVGRPSTNQDHYGLMIMRCMPDIKQKIMENVKCLRGVKNVKATIIMLINSFQKLMWNEIGKFVLTLRT